MVVHFVVVLASINNWSIGGLKYITTSPNDQDERDEEEKDTHNCHQLKL
jgi:hypothetical protein